MEERCDSLRALPERDFNIGCEVRGAPTNVKPQSPRQTLVNPEEGLSYPVEEGALSQDYVERPSKLASSNRSTLMTCGAGLECLEQWAARANRRHGLHSHGLKRMFTHRQRRKVKFQMWSTIMQLAVTQMALYIDFYCEDIMNSIEEAAETIADEMELSQNVMNSNIRLFINHSSFEKAIERSFSQNDIVYQNNVFYVYVADYGFQFISKVNRMSNASPSMQPTLLSEAEVIALYPSDGFMPSVLGKILDLIAQGYQERQGAAPSDLSK
ncbi:uncharacterized protein LACBIDRAFT_327186 [Laccaria bicolor S238N-H82]|uniref:Predicted protein n=1 Tax=Laccaria bicolor (strain S238N-H82 / ATCC MYA-4686) TaxID=486041 RepID=B0DBE8_LACBS|nr:uncharacterized protein LACBIDRAFT_327186 [Laccaria bicolor S238N-H82]EDR07980.1 predicted protein [Laccaria bicolor S238N-H82]|eukprot:XP_001881050.1 predicted protein [Laccaria bicolor S238N-H82]